MDADVLACVISLFSQSLSIQAIEGRRTLHGEAKEATVKEGRTGSESASESSGHIDSKFKVRVGVEMLFMRVWCMSPTSPPLGARGPQLW